MAGLLADLLAVILPVAATAGLGVAWVKTGQPFEQAGLGRLIYLVATPCLIFSALTEQRLALDAFVQMLGLAAGVFALALGGGAVALKLLHQPVPARLAMLLFPNAGNMGLPVCLFAFGPEGLALAVGFLTVSSVLHFSLGIALMAGRARPGFLLRQPLLWAVLAAVAVLVAGVEVPLPIARTVGLIGDLAVPLMLLSLGASLAGVRPRALAASSVLALARPAIGLAAAGLLVALLPVGGLPAKVLLVQSAMPAAVMTHVFALRYDREPELIAGTILISTVAAAAYLPVLLAFML